MFFWYDYLILVLTLVFSTLIGIYFGCFGSKQSTTREYLFGGKKMKVLPVGLSLIVSHFSAITIIGVPADVYSFGAFYWFTCFSQLLSFILALYIYYPVFFKRQLSTAYEYLEKRFDNKTRLLGSFLYVLRENLVLPVIIYSPALALSTVTGIKVSVIALVISCICVFYTAIGGIKTIVWTDIFQFFVIMTSVIIVTWIGVKSTGGFTNVWNAASTGGRLDIFDFDLDPTKKDTFWLYLFGYTVQYLNLNYLAQSTVQKLLTLTTFRDCVMSLICQVIGLILVVTISVFLGLTIYAKYAGCDLLSAHKISKSDEIVSYYIAEITENIPCFSGLFMAAIVSAAISTISSELNSLSGVIYKDFISNLCTRQFTEKSAVLILKLIVVIEGIFCNSLVLLVAHLEELIPLTIRLSGIVQGPLLGLFTLGVLFPKVNSKSAFTGTICGLVFLLFMTVPAYYYKYHKLYNYPTKPFSVDDCQFNLSIADTSSALFGFNSSTTGTNVMLNTNTWKPFFLFRISYYYYCLIGAIVTITVGLIINQLTNRNGSSADRALISPVCHFLLPDDTERDARAMETFIEGHEDVEN
ncbi:unnamed protein product [Tenebrio molitor]|nr:unnamed protein product [Tenebrio molitor]